MKKLLTAFALGLLLVGCARQYDDSELRNRVTTLETKVGNLEANMKAIQSATNDGMFVQKVEELVEDGKVVGVTVTYTTGQVVVTFQISGAGAETNLSAIRNAAGKLCWALNGKILQVDGKDLEVGQTPTFSVENGHLFVTVDGKKTDVGAMGGGLGDAIFKDIKVTEKAVVLTMDDNSTIEIPFAKAFKLVIAKTQYAVTSTDPIEIPYTVDNKTANTVVDVFTDANYEAAVDAEKITITPLAVVKGSALAYADSQVGLTSIVKLNFGAEAEPDTFEITDQSIEYVAEAKDATVEAHAVSNLAFEVKPQVDWIHFVETRATNYTIVLHHHRPEGRRSSAGARLPVRRRPRAQGLCLQDLPGPLRELPLHQGERPQLQAGRHLPGEVLCQQVEERQPGGPSLHLRGPRRESRLPDPLQLRQHRPRRPPYQQQRVGSGPQGEEAGRG